MSGSVEEELDGAPAGDLVGTESVGRGHRHPAEEKDSFGADVEPASRGDEHAELR
jgi:hypothetical protein